MNVFCFPPISFLYNFRQEKERENQGKHATVDFINQGSLIGYGETEKGSFFVAIFKTKSGETKDPGKKKKLSLYYSIHPAHPASSATDPPNTIVSAVTSMQPSSTGSTLES